MDRNDLQSKKAGTLLGVDYFCCNEDDYEELIYIVANLVEAASHKARPSK
jgi:hypothetical protein